MTSTMVWAARAIAVAWAGWWTFFTVAEAIHEPLEALVTHGWMVLLMWGAIALAWKYPAAGGVVLIAEGLFVVSCFLVGWLPSRSGYVGFVILTLAVPPILAGLMLLGGGGRRLAAGTST